MVKLYEEFKDRGFIVLAIDIKEKKEIVKKFMKRKPLPFPVLLDTDGKVTTTYGVRAHPDHFLINGRGVLVGRALGARDWASNESRDLIRFLVEQNNKGE